MTIHVWPGNRNWSEFIDMSLFEYIIVRRNVSVVARGEATTVQVGRSQVKLRLIWSVSGWVTICAIVCPDHVLESSLNGGFWVPVIKSLTVAKRRRSYNVTISLLRVSCYPGNWIDEFKKAVALYKSCIRLDWKPSPTKWCNLSTG